MKNITVGKLTRDPIDLSYQIRIDRHTVMGNPFYLPTDADEQSREFNLRIYRLYLGGIICQQLDPRPLALRLAQRYQMSIPTTYQCPSLKTFVDEFERLTKLAQTQPIELMCFCHPKKCHGDILKSAIEWQIGGRK